MPLASACPNPVGASARSCHQRVERREVLRMQGVEPARTASSDRRGPRPPRPAATPSEDRASAGSLALVASAAVHAADDATRIAAFLRWIEDAAAGRTQPWRFGTALFDDEHPAKWDANFLRVERSVGAATAAELATDADRLLAHLAHREFVFLDDGEGARLAAGFVDLGYTSERLVAMSLRRDPDRPPPADRDGGGLLRGGPRPAARDRASRLPRARVRRCSPTIACSANGSARATSRPASTARSPGCCQLYERDGAAQIESVDTLEEYRGRGVARAFVTRAIDAARDGGADLIFLIADDADWPKQLYGKLGFDEVSHSRQFTRPPPSSAAA